MNATYDQYKTIDKYMKSKIWLSPPHMSGNELDYINEAFKTNWISTSGNNIDDFECVLESYLGENSHAVALSSGTSAIHLALILLGVKKDDEVICQTFTFCASANPIRYLGAHPIFVDSELDTWNINPIYLEDAIKGRLLKGKTPKAIIAVNSYGMPAKWDEIIRISKKYNIPIIEDAAESLGSCYKEQKCGTFGGLSVFSFNGNKIITTSAGGAIICKNKETKDKAIFLATQAKDKIEYYEHSEVGYNYRMSNILAGIGVGQMKMLQDYVKKRRDNNTFYKTVFKDVKGVTIFQEPSNSYYSNHWLNCILIDKETTNWDNNRLHAVLKKENIESRFLWTPLHTQTVFEKYEYFGNNESVDLFNNGLALPSGSNLTIIDKERIKDTINRLVLESKI